jgi:hypothetical protein
MSATIFDLERKRRTIHRALYDDAALRRLEMDQASRPELLAAQDRLNVARLKWWGYTGTPPKMIRP